ncbi:MAG: hypothetical protein ACRDRG_08385 [Pseudonocardiaceae bacterium]
MGFGSLLELNVLDTRQFRADQVVDAFIAPRDPQVLDPALTLTGDAQERLAAGQPRALAGPLERRRPADDDGASPVPTASAAGSPTPGRRSRASRSRCGPARLWPARR